MRKRKREREKEREREIENGETDDGRDGKKMKNEWHGCCLLNFYCNSRQYNASIYGNEENANPKNWLQHGYYIRRVPSESFCL